jgi:uncharacterized membrane protein
VSPQRRARIVHVLFDIGVIAKGVDGVLETIGGVLLLFVSPTQIHSLVAMLTQHELSEDPSDLVSNYLLNSTRDLSTGATVFAATYLLWHGIVKIGLVAALLLRRRCFSSTSSIGTRTRTRRNCWCCRSSMCS